MSSFVIYIKMKINDVLNAILILNDVIVRQRLAVKEKYLCAKIVNLEIIRDITDLWNKRTIMQIPTHAFRKQFFSSHFMVFNHVS